METASSVRKIVFEQIFQFFFYLLLFAYYLLHCGW